VLWGTGDAFLPVRYAEEQRRFFDVVDVHLMEKCGHWPFIDEPERAAALIVPYLRKRLGLDEAAAEGPHVG
jgi:pimeloyl-ACP methyl ester carboxylesterase